MLRPYKNVLAKNISIQQKRGATRTPIEWAGLAPLSSGPQPGPPMQDPLDQGPEIVRLRVLVGAQRCAPTAYHL